MYVALFDFVPSPHIVLPTSYWAADTGPTSILMTSKTSTPLAGFVCSHFEMNWLDSDMCSGCPSSRKWSLVVECVRGATTTFVVYGSTLVCAEPGDVLDAACFALSSAFSAREIQTAQNEREAERTGGHYLMMFKARQRQPASLAAEDFD